jgi:hypothetical protein
VAWLTRRELLWTRVQTFVWLGHGAPSLSNLTAAMPTRLSTLPSVSNLMGSDEGASLAQRLGARRQRASRSHSPR